ncbi:hypothetical protein SAMN04515618_11385 [Collimonas sp. OK307]|uniref:DUF4124 domain-containing protein n=1 Tax=Collimonas sp. OK307 TaxID=1801620 RepID=UPI0008EE6DEA|nr:DUF4124 domain-containing protein [Collimonas sp. OK307]SFI19966.1 hypothetical protein SAMN04515618_11385 [Collimonas sp. OK307]
MKRPLLRFSRGFLLLAAASMFGGMFSATVRAQSEVFLCVDQNGVKEYKNTGDTKGCKRVSLPPLTVTSSSKSSGGGGAASSKPAASTPSDFPKVDNGTQKARDNDRRQILQDEMKSEQERLANLKKDYNDGTPDRQGNERNYAKYQERVASMKEDIARSEKNIDALNRELSNLK